MIQLTEDQLEAKLWSAKADILDTVSGMVGGLRGSPARYFAQQLTGIANVCRKKAISYYDK